MNQCNLQRL